MVVPMSALVAFSAGWPVARLCNLRHAQRGTFIQNCIHGNLGHIRLAAAFYYLGDECCVRAGIIAGFPVIFQNFLAVSVLQLYSSRQLSRQGSWTHLWKVSGSPIIPAALLGIAFFICAIPLPLIVDRSLKILSDLALPVALFVIGASPPFKLMRRCLAAVMVTTGFKLILLPAADIETATD
jgi:predicted permease